MQFTTPVTIKSKPILDYRKTFMLLGSCFSEHIGRKLQQLHFTGTVNPYGVLYNPLSIAKGLERLIEKHPFENSELFEHNGLWHSWMHHGSFSDSSEEKALENINNAYNQATKLWQRTDVLFITFGSSWVYEFEHDVVANCHKVPAKQFTKRRLDIDEIVTTYDKLFQKIGQANPVMQIVLTVSPVRYGIDENQTNKAVLLLAVEALCKGNEQVTYFPAYEIVNDELRDYRYYAEDMIHPSTTAVNYVWEKFGDTFFSNETKQLISEVEEVNRGLAHKPLHPDSDEYQKFKEKLEQKIEHLRSKNIDINT